MGQIGMEEGDSEIKPKVRSQGQDWRGSKGHTGVKGHRKGGIEAGSQGQGLVKVRGQNLMPSGSRVGTGSPGDLSFPIPPPASPQGTSQASWRPGTSPNTALSSRASPCAPFKALGAGPGGRWKRSDTHGGPGRCSAHKVSPLPAATPPWGPSHAPKAPLDRATRPVAGPGPGSPPHCLGSHRCPGSASWTSHHETKSKCWAHAGLWAR